LLNRFIFKSRVAALGRGGYGEFSR